VDGYRLRGQTSWRATGELWDVTGVEAGPCAVAAKLDREYLNLAQVSHRSAC